VLVFFQGNYAKHPHLQAALQVEHGLWRIEALLGIAEKRTDPGEALNHLERAFSIWRRRDPD